MVLQSRYQILKCGEEFDGRSWLPPQDSEKTSKVLWHRMNTTSYRLLSDQHSLLSGYTDLGSHPNMWLDLVNDNLTSYRLYPLRDRLKPASYLQMVVGGTCPENATSELAILRVCKCRVTQIRRTKDPKFSSNLTDLSVASLAQAILFEMPFTMVSYTMRRPSGLESFIYNPPTMYSGVDNPVWSYSSGCFTNVSRTRFEGRLATALNTFLMATYNSTVLTGADGTTLSGRNDMWHNTTATWTEFTEKQYAMNVAWFCISAISTLILLACIIANIVIRHIIMAPDFLESIDGLTRDSPYIKITDESPYMGTGGSAGDRLLITKEIKAQIQDVQPVMDIGRIALTTDVRDAKLDRTRVYC
ncbi:hypothetical protein F53441_11614 [Fusarium austroafricanum]|uniref:Uncharacterized protein n=1 Tax=Fusarium austroafricanum TaxID=2364996 RepID=A0A8H4K398_9HYPO|nr:hypothetical protein F53441_11614 [Fusarium austroafricanum]